MSVPSFVPCSRPESLGDCRIPPENPSSAGARRTSTAIPVCGTSPPSFARHPPRIGLSYESDDPSNGHLTRDFGGLLTRLPGSVVRRRGSFLPSGLRARRPRPGIRLQALRPGIGLSSYRPHERCAPSWSSIPSLVSGELSAASAMRYELPQVSTVGILGRWSIDRPLVDLSTNRVAE